MDPPLDDDAREALATATKDIVASGWRRWGTVDDDVLTHLINPSFTGGPRWPAQRQAYRTARAGGRVLLASDGLAAPFDPRGPDDRNGLGLEVFAITGDPVEPVAGSWLWGLVWNAAQLAAKHGGIADLIAELGTISTELYDVEVPAPHQARFVNGAGRVGVLLGLVDEVAVPRQVDGPLSTVRLVSVVLLSVRELDYCLAGRDAGRAELVHRLCATGDGLISSLVRPDVV